MTNLVEPVLGQGGGRRRAAGGGGGGAGRSDQAPRLLVQAGSTRVATALTDEGCAGTPHESADSRRSALPPAGAPHSSQTC